MARPEPLVLPVSALVSRGDDGLVIRHDGDVFLGQTLGARLAELSSGGNVTLACDAHGRIQADGLLHVRANVDAVRLDGRVVEIGPHEVYANAVIGREQVIIRAGARVSIDVVSAPEVWIEDGTTGRIRLLDSPHAPSHGGIRGCLSVEAFDEAFGDADGFLATRRVLPQAVGGGRRPTAPGVDDPPPPHRTATPEAAPPAAEAPDAITPLDRGFADGGFTTGFGAPSPSFAPGTPALPEANAGAPVEEPAAKETSGVEALAADDAPTNDPEEPEFLESGAYEVVDFEDLESGTIEASAIPEPEPEPEPEPARTRAKQHAQIRRAWERIASCYEDDLPDPLVAMGRLVKDNHTVEVVRSLDAFWADTLRAHLAQGSPPPRHVVRAFQAMRGLRR